MDVGGWCALFWVAVGQRLTLRVEPRPGFVARGDARGHGPRKGKWTLCSRRQGWCACPRPSAVGYISKVGYFFVQFRGTPSCYA